MMYITLGSMFHVPWGQFSPCTQIQDNATTCRYVIYLVSYRLNECSSSSKCNFEKAEATLALCCTLVIELSLAANAGYKRVCLPTELLG